MQPIEATQMLVANLSVTSAGPGSDIAVRPSAPVPAVADPRRQPNPGPATEEGANTGEAREDATQSLGPASSSDEETQAKGLIAAFGEDRVRLAYDHKLSRVFVELLDPRTGDVVTRVPPKRLVEQLNSVADRGESEAARADQPEDASEPADDGDESRSDAGGSGQIVDELV